MPVSLVLATKDDSELVDPFILTFSIDRNYATLLLDFLLS